MSIADLIRGDKLLTVKVGLGEIEWSGCEQNSMTMSSERTRSIIQTREFLVDLSRNQGLPEGVRIEASRLLRHYPTSQEVLLAGRLEEQRADSLTEPFLSSNID